jgi:hypothetical protein
MLLQSYPYGNDKAIETMDNFLKKTDTENPCNFTEAGSKDAGKKCLEKIKEAFASHAPEFGGSLAEEIRLSRPLPTVAQWTKAELTAVSFFHKVQDFVAYHEHPQTEAGQAGKVDIKWMQDNAEKLCDLPKAQAILPSTHQTEQHKFFKDRVDKSCFQANFIVYLLLQLGVPADKKISFRGDIDNQEAEWTLGIFEGKNNLAQALKAATIKNGCDRVDNFGPGTSFPTCLCGTAECKQEKHSGCDVFTSTCKAKPANGSSLREKNRTQSFLAPH